MRQIQRDFNTQTKFIDRARRTPPSLMRAARTIHGILRVSPANPPWFPIDPPNHHIHNIEIIGSVRDLITTVKEVLPGDWSEDAHYHYYIGDNLRNSVVITIRFVRQTNPLVENTRWSRD